MSGKAHGGANKPRSALRLVGEFPTQSRRIVLASRRGDSPRLAASVRRDGAPLVVGSKRFTESYILGEICAQTLAGAGRPADHKPGLGNTGILERALASGAVDLYPEYTGTIVRELLKRDGNPVARGDQSLARAARLEGRGPARLQQHLCAGDDPSERRGLGIAASPICSSRAPALQARPVARVPRARRRLAGAAKAYGCRSRRPIGPRPRPRLRRLARGPRRRDRHLLDRRQDRALGLTRAARTTSASSRSTTRCVLMRAGVDARAAGAAARGASTRRR